TAATPWLINEIPLTPSELDADLQGATRVTDFELVPRPLTTTGGYVLDSFDVERYYTAEIGNAGPFARGDIVRVGPGFPPNLVNLLRSQNLRPIDIEFRPYERDLQGGIIPPEMIVTAVPESGDASPIVWDILLEHTQDELDQALAASNPPMRPVDIEFTGPTARGSWFERGYAVLMVENATTSPLGERDWRIAWNVDDAELSVLQSERVGQLVDFEIRKRPLLQFESARYNVILNDWQGQPRYTQLVSTPTHPGGLYDDQGLQTLVGGSIESIPMLTAGYRPIDLEYQWAYDTNGLHPYANAVAIDAPTAVQRAVRDALDAAAVDIAKDNNETSGLDAKEIGGDRLTGIHTEARITGTFVGGPNIFSKSSPPAAFAYAAVYAYLFDDLTEGVFLLNTCEPRRCPVPTTICDPQSFTIAELVNRMLDVQDYSAYAALADRYGINFLIWTFNQFNGEVASGGPGSEGCTSQFRFKDLTNLVADVADGTLAQGQLRDTILDTLLDDSASLAAAIDAVIDDQALEVDLSPSQIASFKAGVRARQRVFTIQDADSGNERTASLNLVSLPVCGTGGAVVSRQFASSALVESAAFDPTSTDDAVAASLIDAIADALDGWPDCAAVCVADTNGDGALTPGDFNAWVIAFNTNSPTCDQNGDGVCAPNDFNAWILNYNAGC
ncbi:MAG: GC-type dockerin domain-anchored protein, partial [Planctomycetota bacterium]